MAAWLSPSVFTTFLPPVAWWCKSQAGASQKSPVPGLLTDAGWGCWGKHIQPHSDWKANTTAHCVCAGLSVEAHGTHLQPYWGQSVLLFRTCATCLLSWSISMGVSCSMLTGQVEIIPLAESVGLLSSWITKATRPGSSWNFYTLAGKWDSRK